MRRRALLASIAGAATASGCLGLDGFEDSDATRTRHTPDRNETATPYTPDPTETETPTTPDPVDLRAGDLQSCPAGTERLFFDLGTVNYGHVDGVEIVATPERVERGDDITFRMANRTDEPMGIGSTAAYLTQMWTGEEWEHIFASENAERAPIPDDMIGLEPGDPVVWEFRATAEELAPPGTEPCGELVPATYRFCFPRGPLKDSGSQTLGVTFDIVDG